jgi:spore germination protein YaaH
MADNNPGKPSSSTSDSLAELIGRALTDRDFRELLFTNRARALRGYTLSDMDFEALENMDRAKFEDAVTKLGGRTNLAIKVVIEKKF